jgi:hypothetical protein
VERIEGLVTGDDWTSFLAQSRRFHHYSPNNQALLAAQLAARAVDTGDGLVASYRTWQRIPAEGGGRCQVSRGEKALWVYAPLLVTRREVDDGGDERVVVAGLRGFKPVPVFHQSQLDRPPAIVEPPLPKLLEGDDAPQHVWRAITAELTDAGYQVGFATRARGVTWNGQTDFVARTVTVHDDLEPPQRLKTLAHEWAHVTLEHASSITGPSRQVAEVEAESVAYLLCATVNVDAADYTIPYVSGWAGGDIELVKRTAERVLATTAAMVGRLEDRLDVHLTHDPLAAAQVAEVSSLEARGRRAERHEPEPPPIVAESAAWQLVVDRAGPQLTRADQEALAGQPAPTQVAYLMACAGIAVDQAAGLLRDLDVPADTARTALTAITPFADLDIPAAPLYRPDAVSRAVAAAYPSAGERAVAAPADPPLPGLALIDEWSRLQAAPPLRVPQLHHPNA